MRALRVGDWIKIVGPPEQVLADKHVKIIKIDSWMDGSQRIWFNSKTEGKNLWLHNNEFEVLPDMFELWEET